jgi:hypothetical protein
MNELVFDPQPFSTRSCACADGEGARFSQRSIYAELDEPEWDVQPPGRELPAGVEERASLPAVKPIQCSPNLTTQCPALPEVWRSHKIATIPFYYEPTIKSVPNTGDKRRQVTARGRAYKVELVPSAWLAASNWIVLMAAFNMPITEILTAGAGRYCRCVRSPKGVCREAKATWGQCTGMTISDHGYGDALDIIGVKWADKALVGSSTDYTVIHSWRDSAEQAPLLIRINALLRVAFSTVLDYSRADHRDHFHCDMNDRIGRPRKVWEESPCEPNFVTSALRNLGYLPKGQAVSWANAKPGLIKFAAKVNAPLPADQNDHMQWRPLVSRLFSCVALSNPASCHA